MKSIRIKFPNKEGFQLSARLEMPVIGKPKAFAVFAHCFTCSKNLNAVSNISDALTNRGIAVFRFDFTGLGQSGGDFADTNFSSNISDLTAAYEFLEANYEAPQIFIGHSLGGAAVLHTSGNLSAIKAVVTIGAPADPPHVKHLIAGSISEIEKEGVAKVDIGGRPFTIKKQFIDDLESASGMKAVSSLGKALLIIHSPQDMTVKIENAAQIYTAAKHPKSFVSLDGADHLMSRKEDSIYVGEIISTWANKYIEVKTENTIKPEGDVTVRTGEDGFTTEVQIGKHHLLADEPLSVGGSDLGPTPYDYLTAALAACTSMTLRMYADHKKWDLKEVTVNLKHNKTHKTDCESCEEKPVKIDHFDRFIKLEGDLDETQRKRLLEIADRCPVHRTLHGEVLVTSQLIED